MTTRFGSAAALAAVTSLVLIACTDGPVGTSEQLSLGTWGGSEAAVIATDSVTHVHVGCTFGDLVGRVPLDAEGRFTLNGTYVLRAYPVYVGPELPAQFSGRVSGGTLTLAVAVNDTVTGQVVSLGPVTVRYGRDPQMAQCPICQVPRLPGVRPEAAIGRAAAVPSRSGARQLTLAR